MHHLPCATVEEAGTDEDEVDEFAIAEAASNKNCTISTEEYVHHSRDVATIKHAVEAAGKQFSLIGLL